MMFDGKEGKLTCTLLMHLTLYLCAFRSPWFRRIGPWWISRSSINCYCWVLFFFYFSSLCLPQDFREHEIRHIILLSSSTQTRMNRYWLFFVNWKLNKYLNIQVAYIYNERAKFYLQYKFLKCFPNKTSRLQRGWWRCVPWARIVSFGGSIARQTRWTLTVKAIFC